MTSARELATSQPAWFSPRMRLCWLLVPCLLLAGCGDDDHATTETTPEPDPAMASSPPGSTAPILTVSPPSLPPDDLGAWEVESLTAAITPTLNSLKAVLLGKKTFAKSELPDIPTDGLTNLDILDVGTSRAFVVRRAQLKLDRQVNLEPALGMLQHRFTSKVAKLAEIKVVRVTLADGVAQTELYVHLADETLQLNAIWNASWSLGSAPTLKRLQTARYEECERKATGRLVDSSGAVLGGVTESEHLTRSLDHWVARIETHLGIEVSGWHGITAADVNGDGLDDIFLPDGGGLPNRLFLQQADGTVRDASHHSGMALLDHTFCGLFVDLDNDGDQDAALSLLSGVLLLENDGSGRFTPRTSKLFPSSVPYSLSAADFDEDGDLDLYAACYTRRYTGTRHSFVARPIPYHDATNGGRNELLRNEGSFRFRIATKAIGLHADNQKFSYSSSWDDYDNDGDLDLYVANDFGRNHLYQNQLRERGEATFKEVAAQAGVLDIAAGMSTCWGDYDNDGLVDLYVGNMFSSAGNRIAFQDQFKGDRDAATLSLYQRHARGNSLFRNRGDGTFEDVSLTSGTTMGRWAWSSLFADLDNDGWRDLIVTNGFITQEDTGDL